MEIITAGRLEGVGQQTDKTGEGGGMGLIGLAEREQSRLPQVSLGELLGVGVMGLWVGY